MKKAFATALLAMQVAYAQTSIAASDTPTIAAGRNFTCVLLGDIDARPGVASCAVDRPVLADDRETIAIEKGWRVNGVIGESGTKIFWKAVQTGDQVGAVIYQREQTMSSDVSGARHAGDILTVSVSRVLVLPKK